MKVMLLTLCFFAWLRYAIFSALLPGQGSIAWIWADLVSSQIVLNSVAAFGDRKLWR
jgi:hypothetical protein